MRAKSLAILGLFFLSGCLEDVETDLASCQLKYAAPINESSPDNVLLCMSAKGYSFQPAWNDSHQINIKCWGSRMSILDKGKEIPELPFFAKSECYQQRSFFTRLKGTPN